MQLDCIVLAGGLGTRLQSVVSENQNVWLILMANHFYFT